MKDFAAYLVDFMGKGFIRALPLVILTVPLSIWLKKSNLAKRWIPMMRAKPVIAIAVATIAGAVSPLCSCGVIPVIAGLLRAGTPLGPVMAFWIASPSMDPEIFVLSTAYLGLPLAVARLIVTTLASVAAGLTAHFMEKRGLFGSDYLRGAAKRGPAPRPTTVPRFESVAAPARPGTLAFAPRQSCSCSTPAKAETPAISPSLTPSSAAWTTGLFPTLKSLAKESLPGIAKLSGIMLLAFFLEALVIRFVPVGLIAPLLGEKSAFAVPLATLIGVPLYATNLAALGLISGLLAKGMSGGAALAFLLGGAATTLPAMTAVWSLVKPRVFALYLGSIVASALAAGWLYNLVWNAVRGVL